MSKVPASTRRIQTENTADIFVTFILRGSLGLGGGSTTLLAKSSSLGSGVPSPSPRERSAGKS